MSGIVLIEIHATRQEEPGQPIIIDDRMAGMAKLVGVGWSRFLGQMVSLREITVKTIPGSARIGDLPRFHRIRHAVLASLAAVLWLSGCDREAPDAWRPLFNGRDLSGWEHVGAGRFVVQDGMLRSEGGMGLLWYTREVFGNAVIRVVYRNPGGTNSGVFIRIPRRPADPWMPVHRGYEIQIDDRGDDYHVTGSLYSLTRPTARPARADDWNTMEITLDADRTVVSINGMNVTNYREGQPVPPRKLAWEPERGPRPISGYIGLQNHGDQDIVYFREVSVRQIRKRIKR